MLTELYQRGPLSVLINAMILQFYHKGVWDPLFACSPSDLDHGKLHNCLMSGLMLSFTSCSVSWVWN